MNAELDLALSHPEQVAQAIDPSLRDSNAVQFTVTADDTLHITVESEKLGVLRGATNTAFMLTKLADNVFTR